MTRVTYQIITTLGTTEGLTGIGLEQIIDPIDGTLIAKFWNGNFVTHNNSSLNTESAQGCAETVILEEVA